MARGTARRPAPRPLAATAEGSPARASGTSIPHGHSLGQMLPRGWCQAARAERVESTHDAAAPRCCSRRLRCLPTPWCPPPQLSPQPHRAAALPGDPEADGCGRGSAAAPVQPGPAGSHGHAGSSWGAAAVPLPAVPCRPHQTSACGCWRSASSCPPRWREAAQARTGRGGGLGGPERPPVATTCLGPSLPPPHPKRVRAMGVIAAAQSNKRPTPSVLQPPSLGTACPIARVLPAPWPSPVPLPAQGQSWRPQPFPPIRPVSPGPIPSCRPCMRGCVPAGAGSEGRVGGQGTPRRHLPAGRAAFVWGFFLLPQRFLIFEKCCCWVLKTDCVAPEAEILHLHGAGYCR